MLRILASHLQIFKQAAGNTHSWLPNDDYENPNVQRTVREHKGMIWESRMHREDCEEERRRKTPTWLLDSDQPSVTSLRSNAQRSNVGERSLGERLARGRGVETKLRHWALFETECRNQLWFWSLRATAVWIWSLKIVSFWVQNL